MNFLIIGLGSMGKRRIRNLQYLKAGKIIGLDVIKEKREEAEKLYGIKTIESIDDLHVSQIDTIIVSTPPDKHNEWIAYAIGNKKPVFVEASVIKNGLAELNGKAKRNNVIVAPSCTFRFHPAIKIIKNIVDKNVYGKITNFSYHIGQYLPDWHPWEKLSQSYTSKKETGGAREMVAFEMTWLTDIVGYPKKITGFFGKTMDMGINIDDTYVFSITGQHSFGSVVVDVVSRYATKRLIMNLERCQILWSWDEPFVRLYKADAKIWSKHMLPEGKAAEGYNKNIIEEMYIEEMKAYIQAVRGKTSFPNTLSDDIKILKILDAIERR